VRGIMSYCADYPGHSVAMSGDGCPDDSRLSEFEPRFGCTVCSKRGADVRPDFNLKPDAGRDDGLLIR
jgi:hypothetical protein